MFFKCFLSDHNNQQSKMSSNLNRIFYKRDNLQQEMVGKSREDNDRMLITNK